MKDKVKENLEESLREFEDLQKERMRWRNKDVRRYILARSRARIKGFEILTNFLWAT